MRKNFGGSPILYPMPVLIVGTYDKDGKPNAMTAAWGGIFDTTKLSICIDPSHKTSENLILRKAFTVSVADEAHVAECDYLGISSANTDPDKFKKSNFTTTKSTFVDAPLINELPLCLECKVESYDQESGCLVAEILNVSADDRILHEGDSSKIDVTKLKPITYDPMNKKYIALGPVVGTAFSDGKKFF